MYQTKAPGEHIPLPRHVIISKCIGRNSIIFMSADLSVSWHYGITLRRVCTRPREGLLQNYKAYRDMLFFSRIFDSSYVLSCGRDFKRAV